MQCARCDGLLISERQASVVDNVKDRQLQATRCVNCGAIDDPVIISNRLRACHPASMSLRGMGRGRKCRHPSPVG